MAGVFLGPSWVKPSLDINEPKPTPTRQKIRLQSGLQQYVTVRHLRGFPGYMAGPNAATVLRSVNCAREERI